MNAFRIETTVETDGELHLTHLPWHKGDRVEAVVRVLDTETEQAASRDLTDEQKRDEALRRFQARADASRFRSVGPYPSRDDLHVRD